MDHRHLFHNGSREFKNNFRIKYYLNNINNKIIVNKCDIDNLSVFNDTDILNEQNEQKKIALLRNYIDHPIVCNKQINIKYAHYNRYFLDLYYYLEDYKKKYNITENDITENDITNNDIIQIIFSFGDNTRPNKIPCFVKAKKLLTNDYSVLLKLNTERHTSMLPSIKQQDIPFSAKKNKVLWRGAATGLKIRYDFVKKYQNTKNPNIDIKFTLFPQKIPEDYKIEDFQKGNKMSISEMLKYKFLISIEGNDVATNLKWCLLSNSVVLQPIPTKCSWFMEDMLIPFEHFVPLNDDLTDVEEKLQWCMNNLQKCEQISKNATIYMQQFLDTENEKYITNEVIRRYLKNVEFAM